MWSPIQRCRTECKFRREEGGEKPWERGCEDVFSRSRTGLNKQNLLLSMRRNAVDHLCVFSFSDKCLLRGSFYTCCDSGGFLKWAYILWTWRIQVLLFRIDFYIWRCIQVYIWFRKLGDLKDVGIEMPETEVPDIAAWSKKQWPIRWTLYHSKASQTIQQVGFSVLFGCMAINISKT